jgi:DNA invertase Pin-like site-specific DNA recombinase
MIAAIYARKSTDEGAKAEEAKSVTRQIEHGKEYARSKGWTVLDDHIYKDDGVSGAEWQKREGLARLLNALKPKPPFQVLIMSEESRLGREQIETSYTLKKITEAGVRVFFYLEDKERKLDTATDKLLFSVTNFAAEMEREKASQRTRDKHVALVKAGYVTSGRVYGYNNVRVGSHTEREVTETEAAVVRRIFSRRAEGWGAYRIAEELETLGIPSPRGKATWTEAQVNIICRNPLYRGEIVWGRTKGVVKGGTLTREDSPENIIRKQVPHLRLVDEKTWAAVQEQMDRAGEYYKNRLGSTPHVSPGLLSPIAACGVCGGSMYLRKGTDCRSRKEYPSYVCTRNSTKGSKRQGGCTNGHRLPQERADEAIITALEDQFLARDGEAVLQIIMAELSRLQRNQDDRASIEANISQLEQELGNLVKATKRLGGSPTLDKAIREQEEDLGRLRAQLDQIQVLEGMEIEKLMIEAAKRAADWKRYLRGNPVGITQSLLRKLFPEKIKFTPGEHGVWKFEGQLSYGKFLEGLLPKLPRTGRSSSW